MKDARYKMIITQDITWMRFICKTKSLCLWWDKMLCEQDFYVKTCNA
jgi:hypothetical protein